MKWIILSNLIYSWWIPKVWPKLIFKLQKQPLDNKRLGKTNIKYCKLSCRLELDIELGTIENAAEFNSTLDGKDLKLLHFTHTMY